ncbi:MAG: hypothetical protein JNM69_18375 [Archangium sp.]|nr:hypothetical protein [Archangium sp.]
MPLQQPRLTPYAVFTALTATLCFRGWPRLEQPSLWAEDGLIFLYDAVSMGWASLVEPYAGYVHLLPRLLALVFSHWLPLSIYPHAVYLSSVVLFAAILTFWSEQALVDVIPSAATRRVAVWVCCFCPGLEELLGNLANLHSLAFLFLCGLLLARFRRRFGPIDFVLVTLAATTSGEGVVLSPIIAAVVFEGLKARRRDHLVVAGLFVAAMAWHSWALVHAARTDNGMIAFDRVLDVELKTLAHHFVTAPWLGSRAASFYGLIPGWASLVVFPVFAVITLVWAWRRHAMLFALLSFSWSGVLLIGVLFRPDNDLRFLGLWFNNPPVWRQDFVGAAAAAVLWVALLQRSRIAVAAFAVASMVAIEPYLRFTRFEAGSSWAQFARQLESNLASAQPFTIDIPIDPSGFVLHIERPRPPKPPHLR